MRFLRFPLLALMTGFLLSGCGGGENSGKQAPLSAESAVSNKAPASKAPRSRARSAVTSDAVLGESAAAPEADFAKEAPAPRAPKTADKPAAREEAPPEANPQEFRMQIRAGTLTAGSLNDHQNLDDFRDYLSQAQQSRFGQNLPPFSLGQRVMIEVHDAEGHGVPDVQVTVTAPGQAQADNEGVLLDTFTRADGKTFFSSGLDANLQGGTFELTVRPPQGEAITQQVSISQSPWVVQLPDVTRQLPQQLDLALVIDTTQSMADELNYLKVELDNIVGSVHRMFPNVEQRYALILYRDQGDEYVVRNAIDFTNSLPDFRSQLAAQSAKGGGDTPEAMHQALENANKLSWRRDGTARVMFLVADAPPHDQHMPRTLAAVKELRQKGVAVYPVAASGPMEICEFVLRATAFLTRGQYLFLTDHSGVGNPHAKPTAPKYEVEPLNQLMIRMIASELAGKPVLAQEIIATEEDDGSPPPIIPQEQNQSAVERPMNQARQAGTPYQPSPGFVHQTPEQRISIWSTTWFRILAAVVIIGGILLLDQRLKT